AKLNFGSIARTAARQVRPPRSVAATRTTKTSRRSTWRRRQFSCGTIELRNRAARQSYEAEAHRGAGGGLEGLQGLPAVAYALARRAVARQPGRGGLPDRRGTGRARGRQGPAVRRPCRTTIG